ncbi:MAG: hypothetical protein FGF48_07315 [Candidatus Brockarchaeota archaeon]|nr:hypothetical protein [Candidatus Brockarchaeota archaeon]
MPELDSCKQLKELKKTLPEKEKSEIDKAFDELMVREKGRIETNINIDLNHLVLVNLCINPFTKNSKIKSGYLFIRTDPFFSTGSKIFDLLLYNPDSKIAILIECKSSISDPSREVNEVLLKIKQVQLNKDLLENIVGDSINEVEFVICVSPEYIVGMREAIRKVNEHICLWSANVVENKIFLIPSNEDRSKAPWERGTHRDGNLTQILVNAIKMEGGSVRIQPFMATSNMGLIVSELFTRLAFELMRTGTSQFSFKDVLTLIERSLLNHGSDEVEKVARSSLEVAYQIGIVSDDTPHENDIFKKKFSLTMRRPHGQRIIEKYISEKAKDNACRQLVEKFRETQRKLFNYSIS